MVSKKQIVQCCIFKKPYIEFQSFGGAEVGCTEKNIWQNKKNKSNNSNIDFNDNDDSNNEVESVTVTKKFYRKIGESRSHLKQWIKLFEATLCFDSWVHQDSFKIQDLEETDEGKMIVMQT